MAKPLIYIPTPKDNTSKLFSTGICDKVLTLLASVCQKQQLALTRETCETLFFLLEWNTSQKIGTKWQHSPKNSISTDVVSGKNGPRTKFFFSKTAYGSAGGGSKRKRVARLF